MTLNPLEEFVVARQLNDPNDAGTYYVRAFVRNAKTDGLIATLNLDNKGSQRFTKTWQVPQDPTGLGFYITITTLVYSDSNYSTLSTVYGSEQTELLVQDRINPFLHTGADVDYKRIKKLIDEAVSQIIIAESKDPERFDYETLASGFESVISRIEDKEIPATDLRPVLSQLEAIGKKIEGIKIPENDLNPLMERIDTAISITEDLLTDAKEESTQTADAVRKFLTQDTEKIQKSIEDIKEQLDNTQMVVLQDKPKKEKPKKSSLDEYLQL